MIVTPATGSLIAYGDKFAVLPRVLVFSLNNYNQCERTGYRTPLYDPLVVDGHTGNMVRRESRDMEHPAEHFRPLIAKQAVGPLRREPVDDEIFITTAVTVDQL